jgi:hypothetical protein
VDPDVEEALDVVEPVEPVEELEVTPSSHPTNADNEVRSSKPRTGQGRRKVIRRL